MHDFILFFASSFESPCELAKLKYQMSFFLWYQGLELKECKWAPLQLSVVNNYFINKCVKYSGETILSLSKKKVRWSRNKAMPWIHIHFKLWVLSVYLCLLAECSVCAYIKDHFKCFAGWWYLHFPFSTFSIVFAIFHVVRIIKYLHRILNGSLMKLNGSNL